MKKTAIRVGAAAFACAIALTASACGGTKQTATRTPEPVYKYTYNTLGADEMPVQCFSGPIDDYLVDGMKLHSLVREDIFEMLKDAGVNTIFGVENAVESDFTTIRNTLDLCDKVGINYVVFDTTLAWLGTGKVGDPASAEFRKRKAFYEQFDSFAGLFLLDEPSVLRFDVIAEAEKMVRENFDDDIMTQVIMFPIDSNRSLYSGDKDDASVTYDMYIDRYLDTVHPRYLAYDRYPFYETQAVRPGWFENLATIRHYAAEYKIPFWGCVQTGGQWEGIPVRLPSECDFNWNINTMLAYGAKGIDYFTGVQSTYHMENAFGNEGLIALDGERTRWWYFAKTFDRHLSAIEGVLMNSANMGILVSGDTPDVIEDQYDEGLILSEFRELKSATGNALVGCFDYKGKTALYVVNNTVNIDPADNETAKIGLNFNGNYAFDVVQQAVYRSGSGKSLELDLEPGEGALVVLR